MLYCRRCGTKLEENARFCHKCGTPVATAPPAPQARPMPIGKNPFLIPVIILIAIVVTAVIVSAIVFAPIYPLNFNQTNQDNQPNINKLNLNFQSDNAQVNVIAQNLTGKNILIAVSATGSTGIFGSTNPIEVTFSNETVNNVLTVTSKVTDVNHGFFSRLRVTCTIYINPSLNLNLNITSETGQITLTADAPATLQSLNLEATTGVVQANLQNSVTIAGDLSLKTQTGSVFFRMNQANVQGNATVNLQSTTGSVNMDITQKEKFSGNVQVNATTTTGQINLGLLIDGDVGAKIQSQTNLGRIRLDVHNFSGNQSPIQSNNYPAASNFQINNTITGIGDINLNAAYQSSAVPSVRN